MAENETPLDAPLRVQWEYQAFGMQGDMVAALNGLGADGWEVCAMVNTPEGKPGVVCKRRKLAVITGAEVTRTLSFVGG